MSREDAEQFEKDLKKAAKAFKAQAPATTSDIVDELFPEYLRWYKDRRAPTTYDDLCLVYEKNISRILGKQKVTGIGPEHFALYQGIRKREQAANDAKKRAAAVKKGKPWNSPVKLVGNRTINKELDYFGGFLRWCRRIKGINCKRPELDRLPTKRPIPIVLTVAEVKRILEQASPFHRAFYLCLYTLGLRVKEARMLKWDDIDIPGMLVRVIQKGGGYKMLPLNDLVLSALKAIKPRDEDPNTRDPAPPQEYIFMGSEGRPVGSVRTALKTTCRKAGVTKHVYPHLFRHSFATHLIAAGVNMSVIQKYLGHAKITTTEWYSHVDVEIMRAAGKGLTELLRVTPEITE